MFFDRENFSGCRPVPTMQDRFLIDAEYESLEKDELFDVARRVTYGGMRIDDISMSEEW